MYICMTYIKTLKFLLYTYFRRFFLLMIFVSRTYFFTLRGYIYLYIIIFYINYVHNIKIYYRIYI